MRAAAPTTKAAVLSVLEIVASLDRGDDEDSDFLVVAVAVSIPAIAGRPISKFNQKVPVAEFDSRAKMEDVERCLFDMDGYWVPSAVRQPDRPDDVMLLWLAGGTPGFSN